MGAGTSATQLIFFITSVIIALSVVGGLFMNIESISSAAIIGSKTLSSQLKTDITVINDPEIIPYSSGKYTFYVKNTGIEEIDKNYTNVLINGTLISESNLNKTIVSGGTIWQAGDILKIIVTVTLPSGSHTLRIITSNGIVDNFPFRK